MGLVEPDVIDSRKSIWIHGASMGEIGIVVKLLPELRKKYPGHPIVVSSTTQSGHERILRDGAGLISHAVFLPMELPLVVRRLMRLINPEKLVIVETELWPNFIVEAKRFGARVVLVNGRISDHSFPTYLFFNFFMARVLGRFDAIGVQTREYYRRFQRLGALRSRMAVTGNVKGAIQLKTIAPEEKERLRAVLRVPAGDRVWIAASTHPGEEEKIVGAFLKLKEAGVAVTLVLAPRYPKRAQEIQDKLSVAGTASRRRSEPPREGEASSIVILDTFGELSDLFAVADLAFVGGTLIPHGGHNLLEPLPFLVPVCFGPWFDTQKESARIILTNQCGLSLPDEGAIFEFALRTLTDPGYRMAMVEHIRALLSRTDIKLKANLDLI